jgi:hypothetical protein
MKETLLLNASNTGERIISGNQLGIQSELRRYRPTVKISIATNIVG